MTSCNWSLPVQRPVYNGIVLGALNDVPAFAVRRLDETPSNEVIAVDNDTYLNGYVRSFGH